MLDKPLNDAFLGIVWLSRRVIHQFKQKRTMRNKTKERTREKKKFTDVFLLKKIIIMISHVKFTVGANHYLHCTFY